jgi:hypothetical protein
MSVNFIKNQIFPKHEKLGFETLDFIFITLFSCVPLCNSLS